MKVDYIVRLAEAGGHGRKESVTARLVIQAFLCSGTAKLFASGLGLWVAASILSSLVGYARAIRPTIPSPLLAAGLEYGFGCLLLLSFILGVGAFICAAVSTVGVELSFLPAFLKDRPMWIAVHPLGIWARTTEPDEVAAIRRVQQLRPGWGMVQVCVWLASRYPHGLKAAGVSVLDESDLPPSDWAWEEDKSLPLAP